MYCVSSDESVNHNRRLSTPSQVRRCRRNKVDIGWEYRESLHFVEKAFTRRSSLRSELRTLGTPVGDDATVDVLGMCLYASPLIGHSMRKGVSMSIIVRGTIFISAWASELLIFTGRQVRRPGT